MLRPDPLDLDPDSRALYERFVPARHPLRQFDAALDFSFVLPLVAERYHDEIGRPAEHPERLWRLLFAEYYLNLADEKVCLAAHESLALRLFLRLGIDETPPHPTTLQKFRANRLDSDVYLKIHFELLRQAQGHGLLRRDERQIFDTSHVRSNTRVVSLPRLLLEARAKVVKEVAKIDPDYGAELAAQAEADYQTYLAARERRKADGVAKPTKEEKVEAARGPVRRTLDQVQARIASGRLVPTERLHVAVAILAKVIADREEGATERIVSVHDIEARKGRKTTVTWDGRKLAANVSDESYFIVAATSAPANANDSELLLPLLDQQQDGAALVPPALIADTAADVAALRAELTTRGIVGHIPRQDATNTRGIGLFTVDDFLYEPEQDRLTCPAGRVVHGSRPYRSASYAGRHFGFRRSWCIACPLLNRCRPAHVYPQRKDGRQVTVSEHWAVEQAARRHNATEAFREAYRRRGRIEPKIWELTYHGQRRCRYRGDARSQCQLLITVVVVNGKRLTRLLGQQIQPPRPGRRSRLL